MREPQTAPNTTTNPGGNNGLVQPPDFHLPRQLPLTHLSAQQLQEMAHRQQQQIEAQQQMLVAKEQRLKYLRKQDFKQQQMAAEYERLRRLREKVEAQELKLRKLRALRGQTSGGGGGVVGGLSANNAAVLADLESIRALFNDKEKELALAVRKVEELTHQLEDLRSGRTNTAYPPQVMELERLRRELTYRRQLNEQQNNMIAQQRAQLAMGQEEMAKIDGRILELQERLARKRLMNQQLASQISAATNAKQAQLRAIQHGSNKLNKNKPVSTVEPFQRQPEEVHQNQINKNGHLLHHPNNEDPKYQTLPFGTKFGQQQQQHMAQASKSQKVAQLKQEKENNNVQFSDDLPPPPPSQGPSSGFGDHLRSAERATAGYLDHQGNFNQQINADIRELQQQRPISSVAPAVYSQTSSSDSQLQQQLKRPTQLFPPSVDNIVSQNSAPLVTSTGGEQMQRSPDSPTKAKPALPPKPAVPKGANGIQQQPPPYVPAPPPDNARHLQQQETLDDSSITIRGNQNYQPLGNLSVSAHSEEGTSVDDDAPSSSDDAADNSSKQRFTNANHNVHISINRRIEMPPAFLFPEDQTPPSDLLGRDVSDSTSDMYPMVNQMYQEFDSLSSEEKNQLLAKSMEEEAEAASAVANYPVPEFESSTDGPLPPSIMRTTNLKGLESSTAHDRHVCFDPLALLLDASLEGELELVKRTARQVPDASAANDEGITALHNAICAGHFDIVRFLVEFGCDVNAQDSDGWTPLHCAASCNNLPMVRFLVEHGACVFATTFSDHETAAEKCEEDEEGYAGCSEYLYSIQEKLGVMNSGRVFAVFDYRATQSDELNFEAGAAFIVVRKGDEVEKDWWWMRREADSKEGYVPKNFLGLFARVEEGGGGGNMSEGSDGGTSSSSSLPSNASSSSSKRKEEEKAKEAGADLRLEPDEESPVDGRQSSSSA